MKYEAIIVGGGHNGLICAAYLARAGRKVLVLERRPVLGGAAVSEEVFPGFTFSVCSYVVSLFRPQIIRELDLPRFGYEIIPLDSAFLPLPDGDSLLRSADPHQTRREIARFSPRDAEAYPEFGLAMTRMAAFVKGIIDRPAPDPSSLDPRELWKLLRLGRAFQGLAGEDRELQLRLLFMSAADFLDLWFESDILKGPMSASGIIGTFLGVRSPGTAYVMLHHYMGEIDAAYRSWGFARGGTGQVSLAAARAAESFGAEIRVNAPVERILMQGDRAAGVVLAGGEEIRAKAVVSGCDPHRTLLGMVGERHLDGDFLTRLRRYRFRGSSGKVNLALDRLPEFSCRPGDGPHLRGDISIAPSLGYMEKAYTDAKYGSVLPQALPGRGDPLHGGPHPGSAREARGFHFRAVCPL